MDSGQAGNLGVLSMSFVIRGGAF